jgi:hypothetical protein
MPREAANAFPGLAGNVMQLHVRGLGVQHS